MQTWNSFNKGLPGFEAFLAAHGADVETPSNEWELCRFRCAEGVGIVYTNKRHAINPNPIADAALEAFTKRRHWQTATKPVNRVTGARRRSPLIVKLLTRDGDRCCYCAGPLEEDITLEHWLSIADGGNNRVANLALAHDACNSAAGSLSVMQKIRLRDAIQAARKADASGVVAGTCCSSCAKQDEACLHHRAPTAPRT